MPLKPIHDGTENSLLVSRRELQLESAGIEMPLKPLRAFENHHMIPDHYQRIEPGDELPEFAPQDDNYKFIAGSWEEKGKTYHQFPAGPLYCPDEFIEALEWCETNGRSLVNKHGLQGIATKNFWQGKSVSVVMIFTDLNEATHARLRWG